MSEKKEDDYVTVRIPRELSDEADKLIGKKGFRSKAEIVKEALRELIEHYEEETHFEMLNHSATGVKVRDMRLRRVADIEINSKGIYCPICDASYCEHIRFAVDQPDIRLIIRQRRKEGWKLPDV